MPDARINPVSVLRHEEPCPRDCEWHASVCILQGGVAVAHRRDGWNFSAASFCRRRCRSWWICGHRGAGPAGWSRRQSKGWLRKVPGRLKVAKVNVDNSPQVSQQYDAMSIPTLLLIRDGQWWIGSSARSPRAAARRVRPARVGLISLDRDGLTRCRHPHWMRLLASKPVSLR